MDTPAERITVPLKGGAELTVPIGMLVSAFLRKLEQDTAGVHAAGSRSDEAPRVGQYVPELGGIWCGRLVDPQDRIYALIVARQSEGELLKATHAQALERCAELRIKGFNDWTAPTRMEALAMWQRLQPALKDTDDALAAEWYWTCEQYADDPAYAWVQSFSYGNQSYDHRGNDYRARAVRRLIIE